MTKKKGWEKDFNDTAYTWINTLDLEGDKSENIAWLAGHVDWGLIKSFISKELDRVRGEGKEEERERLLDNVWGKIGEVKIWECECKAHKKVREWEKKAKDYHDNLVITKWLFK